MTPAINQARKAGIAHQVHEYSHDPGAESYGLEAAEALNLPPARVFKTLIANLGGHRNDLVVAVVPVSSQLDLKALANTLGGKRAELADPRDAERATGYVVGGISPLGQKKRLPLVLDESANQFATLFVSAGRRGLEIELSPTDLLAQTNGRLAPIAR